MKIDRSNQDGVELSKPKLEEVFIISLRESTRFAGSQAVEESVSSNQQILNKARHDADETLEGVQQLLEWCKPRGIELRLLAVDLNSGKIRVSMSAADCLKLQTQGWDLVSSVVRESEVLSMALGLGFGSGLSLPPRE